MKLLDIRWTPGDILRTFLDRTVNPGGYLGVQDDLTTPPGTPEELAAKLSERMPDAPPLVVVPDAPRLPYDELNAATDLFDFRQVVRSSAQSRGRAKGTRKLSQITALWLHQTAALLQSPSRFLSVPVQGGIDLGARAILLHPLRAYMFAAHDANRFSISLEVACRAAGIEGNPETFWRSKKEINGFVDKKGRRRRPRSYAELVREPNDDQLETTRRMVTYYVHEVERQAVIERAAGVDVPGIIAIGTHRNSHRSRVSDCGSRIYHEVVLWAMREYGLQEGPVVGSGTPNPTAWTGTGAIPYSSKVRGF